jgi:hypothetical protein
VRDVLSLPLGEGGAPQGRRMRGSSLLNHLINRFTDTGKIVPYFVIRNALDIQSEIIQVFRPEGILFTTGIFEVLGTVQLHNELGLMTVKINNIAANYFLPAKLHRIIFQKIIPKMAFFFCHIPA